MDDSDRSQHEWIREWIEQQRSLLRARAAQPQGAAHEMHQQAVDLGSKWLDVGHTYLTGLQQFAQGTQAAPAAGMAFELGEEFLGAWRTQWQSLRQPGAAPGDPADVWSEVLRQLPPLGMAREHSATLRELAQAHAECQRLEQELRTMLYGVQTEALNLLEQRVRERQGGQQSLSFRELYDLWVECGEQVYAQVAHSEAYCRLQAQLGNATVQLRARQQKLIEYLLRQFDLPTRSELNSVHRQLREQGRQLRELKAQFEAMQAAGAASQPARQPRSRRKGQTS